MGSMITKRINRLPFQFPYLILQKQMHEVLCRVNHLENSVKESSELCVSVCL